jgi:hypothetical protein
LEGWADTVFELCDAVVMAPGPVVCLPALSLEPVSRRSHGSLYKALAACEVNAEEVRDLLAGSLAGFFPAGQPPVFAVEASTWPRCDAETSPGRGFYYSASKHSNGQPIVAGWCYQVVAGVNWAHDSWTAPVDAVRLEPGRGTVDATIRQLQAVARRLPAGGPAPVFVFDAGYDPAALTFEAAAAGLGAAVVVRVRDDRVFYADPPPRPARPPATGGRPARHGQRRSCREHATWPAPDLEASFHDTSYGQVRVAAWEGLHPRLSTRGHWAGRDIPPIVPATILRVDVERLPKGASSGNKKTLWLWAASPDPPDPATWAMAYLHRFDIEHTFRFMKNTLGWTVPKTATPRQADTWTWVVIAAYTQLRLARPIAPDLRLPWHKPLPPGKLTPGRVKQSFPQLAPQLGTPARPPKPSKPGPGRPKGTRTGPRQRHPAVKSPRTKV